MRVEDRVGQEFRRPRATPAGASVDATNSGSPDYTERLDHQPKMFGGGRLGHADLHRVIAVGPEVDPPIAGGGHDRRRAARHHGPHGVEEQVVLDLDAAVLQSRPASAPRLSVHPLGDPLQPIRPVVHRVHRRHDGQQHLRGADVAGRLLPADVLLPGLQREPERGGAVRVMGHPDQPAGQLPLDLAAHRDEPGVRAAETQRHPEALRRPDRDVRADLAGRAQQGQRQQVGRDRDLRLSLVGGLDQLAMVADGAGRPRVGQQQPEEVTDRQRLDAVRQVGDHHLDPDRLGPGLDDGDGLRERVGVDDEAQ